MIGDPVIEFLVIKKKYQNMTQIYKSFMAIMLYKEWARL